MLRRRWWYFTCLILCAPLWAASPPPPQINAHISIIIDDLGYRYQTSLQAVHSPYALSCSFLPHAPHAVSLAKQAWLLNKDILVHMPMEAQNGKDPGPGGLYQGMSQQAFEQTVQDNIRAIPHAIGINNHMGSLLTTNHTAMTWLMELIARGNRLFFIDSLTTEHSRAMMHANLTGVLGTARDVFLDNIPEPNEIRRQFQRLLHLAQYRGSALAIAHPHPETLAVLEQELPRLAEKGVELVPVSQLVRIRSERRLAWQTSSSPLPRAAKN